VEEGVEPGCVILPDERTGRRFNLIGGDTTVIKIGARVTVVGILRTGLMSHCQQGQIVQVLRAGAAQHQ